MLVRLADSVTVDHVSPAGTIPPRTSRAAPHLARGEETFSILGVDSLTGGAEPQTIQARADGLSDTGASTSGRGQPLVRPEDLVVDVGLGNVLLGQGAAYGLHERQRTTQIDLCVGRDLDQPEVHPADP